MPATKLLPWSFNKLPTIIVGAKLASIKILPIIAVMVVFPCAPETAMVYLFLKLSPTFQDKINRLCRVFCLFNSDFQNQPPEYRRSNQHPGRHCRRYVPEKTFAPIFSILPLSAETKNPSRSPSSLPNHHPGNRRHANAANANKMRLLILAKSIFFILLIHITAKFWIKRPPVCLCPYGRSKQGVNSPKQLTSVQNGIPIRRSCTPEQNCERIPGCPHSTCSRYPAWMLWPRQVQYMKTVWRTPATSLI